MHHKGYSKSEFVPSPWLLGRGSGEGFWIFGLALRRCPNTPLGVVACWLNCAESGMMPICFRQISTSHGDCLPALFHALN